MAPDRRHYDRHYDRTTVSEGQSLTDIEALLRRHRVDAVRWTTSRDLIRLEFSWPYEGTSLAFRITLEIPAQDASGGKMSDHQRDQERRRRLRVLLNHIKAKLVAVEEGLVDLEQEFLAYLLGPGDRTAGEVAAEQMRHAIALGTMPELRLLQEARRDGS